MLKRTSCGFVTRRLLRKPPWRIERLEIENVPAVVECPRCTYRGRPNIGKMPFCCTNTNP